MKNKIYLLATIGSLWFANLANAQVRPDIYSFSALEQDTLSQLMLDYLDSVVISTHSGNTPMVHGNPRFFPFHREYVAGMEDYLILRGYPKFVPLPKWAPEDSISTVFQQIDSDCQNAYGPWNNCNSLVNINANSSRAISNVSWGIDANLCNYSSTENLRLDLEHPWHNGVHSSSIGVNGTMSQFKSPSAVIFWPWHAYVDDVWKEWECNCNGADSVDLWMRDTPMKPGMTPQTMHTMSMDQGIEPNTQSVPHYMWISEDIWIRNQPDGDTTDVHQDPEYNISSPVYVYVRVRNKGCSTSAGNEKLVLYWAKAATALSWPNHWDGTSTIGGPSGPSAGQPIDTLTIDTIKAGGSTILRYEWYPPDTALYSGINSEPWHFCLLARVEAPNDPMTYTETASLYGNVKNNNNIVWKNVTVVDNAPGLVAGGEILPGGVVAIGNVFEYPESFDFEFLSLDFEDGEVYAEAEVLLTLDENSWQKWIDGGQQAENIEIFQEDKRQLIVTTNNAWMRNLNFDGNERSTMHVSFNFLTEEISDLPEFDYHVVQRRAADQKTIGGEKYHIVKPKPDGELFFADGGGDESISKKDSVQLAAVDIGKSALYNWYNSEGKLVHTGKNFTVTPEMTQKYKLEIIAKKDGFKDYDEVMVNVKQYEITGLSPNPAINKVKVKYDTEKAKSAYLQVTRPFGKISNQYILDVKKSEVSIDVSNYQTGVYSVILVVNGKAVDSKNLSVQ